MKSEAGRASVTVSGELGHVLSDSLLRKPRNGASSQRRQERRAAARGSEKESNKQEVEKILYIYTLHDGISFTPLFIL